LPHRRRKGNEQPRGKPPESEPEPVLGTLPDYIGFRLRRAQAASFRHLDRLEGPVPLSPGRFSLLALIESNPGITQTRIARAFNLDKSTLSPVVETLVRAGFILRERSPDDGRAYALTLSPSGTEALAGKRRQIERQEEVMSAPLSREERALLLDMLDRMTAALDLADPLAPD